MITNVSERAPTSIIRVEEQNLKSRMKEEEDYADVSSIGLPHIFL
jgi:hypothetical protein